MLPVGSNPLTSSSGERTIFVVNDVSERSLEFQLVRHGGRVEVESRNESSSARVLIKGKEALRASEDC